MQKLENEKKSFFFYFWIQTDHLIYSRRTGLVVVNNHNRKKNLPNTRLCYSGSPQDTNERKRKQKYVSKFSRKLKKVMEHESEGDTNFDWCAQCCHLRIDKRDKRTRR